MIAILFSNIFIYEKICLCTQLHVYCIYILYILRKISLFLCNNDGASMLVSQKGRKFCRRIKFVKLRQKQAVSGMSETRNFTMAFYFIRFCLLFFIIFVFQFIQENWWNWIMKNKLIKFNQLKCFSLNKIGFNLPITYF